MGRRLILSAIIVAALMIGGFGCMGINLFGSNDTKEPKLSVNKVALLHMEEKYGEPFEFVRVWGDSMSGTRQFMAKCDSLPGEEILVQIENYRDENKIYRDNYLAVKYREETIAFIRDCAMKEFDDVNIYYEAAPDGQSPELTAATSFEGFMSDTRVPINIMLEVKDRSFSSKAQAEKVAGLIAESVACYYLTIAVVENSLFGTFDNDALEDELVFGRFVYCAKITRLDGNIKVKWLERKD